MTAADIDALVARSAANATRVITGALLFDGTAFGHGLEGAAGDLETVYERISCDRRHRSQFLLEYSAITTRTLTGWNMTVVRSDDRLACLKATSSDSGRQIVATLAAALSA